MSRVSCYIDGFNLYHSINDLGINYLKWLNLRTLAESFLSRDDTLSNVIYFTAILNWNPSKSWRHREYIKALKAINVEVIESKFQSVPKYCHRQEQYCKFREEKQTDVAFAIRIAADAHSGKIDRAILITADNDHVPLINYINEKFPDIETILAAPPNRLHLARDLGSIVTFRTEITPGRLGTCLLERNVKNAAGEIKARCPTNYLK